ncbi:class I SAM-dependent methyltransferase [Virgifigura deserti]|uniref:class I SAM-dependent methyltransferase n=1 Tax=Virgifigura deserti TaxID=2268457 RepID=UPI003CCB80AF
MFYEVRQVPTNSCLLIADRDEALAFRRGDIELRFCRGCGFIFNAAFDPSLTEYSSSYEETQAFSSTFNTFHTRLTGQLIKRYGLTGKHILEIGCGKGEFLTLLCELGGNSGVGFDPGYAADRHAPHANDQITFRREFFTEETELEPSDFVCSKMTLEHIPETARFVDLLRRATTQRGATLFLQVPDAVRILKECAFWDIYYEHCSYFSPGSLERLLVSNGFDVGDVWTDFEDQYLMIDARPTVNGSPHRSESAIVEPVGQLEQLVVNFTKRWIEKQALWRKTLAEFASMGRKVVIWGSGSKAVSFLTTLSLSHEIDCVVDVNPYRHGKYMPGTGHRIVGPDEVAHIHPDMVVVMNPIYRTEIRQALVDRGCAPMVLTV